MGPPRDAPCTRCGKLFERVGRKAGRLNLRKGVMVGRPPKFMRKRNLFLFLALASLFLPVTSVRGEIASNVPVKITPPESLLTNPAIRLPAPKRGEKAADQRVKHA